MATCPGWPRILAILRRVSCCAFIVLLALQTQAQAPTQREVSSRKFVQQFYDWYLPKAKTAKGRASDLALKQRSLSFTRELMDQLKADSAAQDKSQDIVGLDFDPFLNTQDSGFEKCVAGKATCDATSCRVEVTCTFPGPQADKSVVTPELIWHRGVWLFANFHYHFDSGDDDLLHLLKGLREDRKPKAKSGTINNGNPLARPKAGAQARINRQASQ